MNHLIAQSLQNIEDVVDGAPEPTAASERAPSETAGPAKVVAAVATGSLPEISPLANAASAAAAKIVHHPRWPRMAADAHALAMKIIVAEMETMLREAWKTPSVLRTHVLRYGPPGYDIYDAAEIARVLGEVPREENRQ